MGQCMKERGEGKKLDGVAPAQKLLVYALLLRWYVEHRAFITAVHRTIDYQATIEALGKDALCPVFFS